MQLMIISTNSESADYFYYLSLKIQKNACGNFVISFVLSDN